MLYHSPVFEQKLAEVMTYRWSTFFQYKDEGENETGINLDELSDEENEDDEISLSSKLSDEAAENVKAIAVENAFMEVRLGS